MRTQTALLKREIEAKLADAKFLLIEGVLQNIDKVIHIRAKHIEELNVTAAPMESHDFH